MDATPDIRIHNHLSLLLFEAVTPAAQAWEGAHLPEDALRWHGQVVIEPRYVRDIVDGARADGLIVEGWQ